MNADRDRSKMFDEIPDLLKTIDILEGLEGLMDAAASPEIEEILQTAWLKISQTFPEDFQEATHLDAGAEGLRRYLRVKAFFMDPTANPIDPEELKTYYRHHAEPVDEQTDFFFPEE
ncbi:MAG: hypothetical protein MUF72_20955 [Elainella sp. Prado103]|nr:hypothetical protein [Elainella sp. Prado103]